MSFREVQSNHFCYLKSFDEHCMTVVMQIFQFHQNEEVDITSNPIHLNFTPTMKFCHLSLIMPAIIAEYDNSEENHFDNPQ